MGDEFDSDDDFTSQGEPEDMLQSGTHGGEGEPSNKQVKHKCDTRRRLEIKLEERRLEKQVQDYHFDEDLDDDFH